MTSSSVVSSQSVSFSEDVSSNIFMDSSPNSFVSEIVVSSSSDDFLNKDFDDYTVTEGLLLILVTSVLIFFILKLFKL